MFYVRFGLQCLRCYCFQGLIEIISIAVLRSCVKLSYSGVVCGWFAKGGVGYSSQTSNSLVSLKSNLFVKVILTRLNAKRTGGQMQEEPLQKELARSESKCFQHLSVIS